jgi:tetratricopeptide (TPR) repeat protein
MDAVMRRGAVCLVLALVALSGAWAGVTVKQPAAEPHAHEPGEAAEDTQPIRDAEWAPFRLLEGQAQYLPAALRAAKSADALARRRGLFALGMLSLSEGIAPARANLKHQDRLVRMQAGVALALLYRAEGLPAAAAALREGPDWLRFYALYGLWRLDSPRSQEALRAARPALDGFLAETLDQALQAGPRFRAMDQRCSVPDEKLSLAALWDAVSGSFVREADLWWHEGNYDQSIRCQWTALFYDPQYVELFSNIAWLQWSMDRHDEAIRTYRQAIQANPQSWEARQALGDYYWRHEQKALGAQYLQEAADLGSPPIPRRALGHAYRELGQPEKAIQVWQDILKLDPSDPIAKRELQRAGM